MRRFQGPSRVVLVLLFCCIVPVCAFGQDAEEDTVAAPFFSDRARGWFWYETAPAVPAAGTHTPPVIPPAGPGALEDPRRALERIREELQIGLARALLDPTPERLRAYLSLNQRELRRAGDFATAWQRLLWNDPALDYRLLSPVDDGAVAARNQARGLARDAAMADLARRHGLWFFFRSDCPICHRFAPVLRRFATRYGFQVTAVSMDGGLLPGFPQSLPNRGAAERLGVRAVPALFLVDPQARQVKPVSQGYLSASELARRLLIIGGVPRSPGGTALLPRPRPPAPGAFPGAVSVPAGGSVFSRRGVLP